MQILVSTKMHAVQAFIFTGFYLTLVLLWHLPWLIYQTWLKFPMALKDKQLNSIKVKFLNFMTFQIFHNPCNIIHLWTLNLFWTNLVNKGFNTWPKREFFFSCRTNVGNPKHTKWAYLSRLSRKSEHRNNALYLAYSWIQPKNNFSHQYISTILTSLDISVKNVVKHLSLYSWWEVLDFLVFVKKHLSTF